MSGCEPQSDESTAECGEYGRQPCGQRIDFTPTRNGHEPEVERRLVEVGVAVGVGFTKSRETNISRAGVADGPLQAQRSQPGFGKYRATTQARPPAKPTSFEQSRPAHAKSFSHLLNPQVAKSSRRACRRACTSGLRLRSPESTANGNGPRGHSQTVANRSIRPNQWFRMNSFVFSSDQNTSSKNAL